MTTVAKPRLFAASALALPLVLALALAAPLALGGCADDSGGTPASDGGGGGGDGGGGGGGDGSTPAGKLTEQQLIDGCLRATACEVRPYPSLSNCLDAYRKLYIERGVAPIFDAIYGCVNAAAGDCAKIAQCFNQGAACDNTYKATCNGTIAMSCDLIDKRVYSQDCAVAGLKCAVPTDKAFTATCTRGTCSSSYTASCEGDVALTCAAGIIERTDCALAGRRCRLNKDGVAGCAGNTTQRCDPRVQPVCSGDTAVSCINTYVHRVDCSATKCQNGTCDAATTTCNAGDQNRCSGDKIEACVGGQWKAYDCKALGLGACVKTAGGWATCAKP